MPIIKCSGSIPESFTTRRGLLTSFGALALVGCQGATTSVRFKVIASAIIDGRPVESSSVMEITYSKVTHSLIGNGGATRLYGEALIFDLDGKGTIYILPTQHDPNNSLTQVYEDGILATLEIRNSIGSLSDADFASLRSANGRYPFKLKTSRLPVIVSFKNENDPKTIFEIQPGEIGRYFSGVQFTGLDIAITTGRLTYKLRKRLPWLDTTIAPRKIFARDPPGALRPYRELPFSYVITPADFFGDASR
ncbi:hypothetical protein AMK06_CH01525 [Rhizobium sp. N541]|uniref:hypothetical protein n=1 Tax=unclassified Rhizobium TaxID=2613769 RepID=UPI0007EE657B|nr:MULTISPECIES: hypothetical protein [unclassified Rhizobium]ANM16453.1 hypothetical protein AMK06_CH01525 [Rhizobium sp. N541]ANM22838.1 hypothetical protein AMK07_CH01522 [Rhizobium sp. N941]